MTDLGFDELIERLIYRILEQSHTPEQANYYTNGVIARLTGVDWAKKIVEIREKQQAYFDAWCQLDEQENDKLVCCTKCNKEIRWGDSVRLDEPPKWRYLVLCQDCAYSIQQEHEFRKNQRFPRTCALCGSVFEILFPSDSLGLCTSCYSEFNQRELYRVNSHLRRAKQLGFLATLTLTEWLRAIEAFGGLCAYCQQQPYEEMEHFIPLSLGGGTTADNCIPACKECNMHKHQKHPEDSGLRFSHLNILRVRHYLQTNRRIDDDKGKEKKIIPNIETP